MRRRLPVDETRVRTGQQEARPPIAAYTPWRLQLLDVRNRRRQPARDEKLVVALNGLAIQAFARAGQWLEMPPYIEVARRSAEHLWRVAHHQDSGLRHEIFNGLAQTDAFLDDYALLGLGFLALYDASGDTQWLQRAGQLADDLLTRFQRADGSLATTTAEKDLPMSPPEDGDNIYPSGSSAAVVKTGTDRDEIVVTLQIEDGYHVNANPASYDYLIATSVAFDGLTPTLLRYPEATLFKPSFAPAGLKVYEGKVTLEASFPKGTVATDREISAVVSTQACNSEICLPPAKLTVTVTVTHDGSF